ncbi:MAG: hypothetical protein LBJ32_04835 [Oscillospiraceae bacterium]|nr:hypothetical protein [Oscillospiraceae bacterium]
MHYNIKENNEEFVEDFVLLLEKLLSNEIIDNLYDEICEITGRLDLNNENLQQKFFDLIKKIQIKILELKKLKSTEEINSKLRDQYNNMNTLFDELLISFRELRILNEKK